MAAGLTQILQETITGHQVVKSFGAEDFESKRFRLAAQRLRAGNLRYVAHQALASPVIEIFGALTFILLLTFARLQAKSAIDVYKRQTGSFAFNSNSIDSAYCAKYKQAATPNTNPTVTMIVASLAISR